MKRNEFEEVIKTLCSYYDDKKLEENTKNIYFEEMKYYNGDLGIYIKEICNSSKFFPKITELKTIKKNIEKSKNYSVASNKMCDCDNCRGSGWIIIVDNGIEYAVACECKNGDNKIYNGQDCKEHKSNYYIPRYNSKMPV